MPLELATFAARDREAVLGFQRKVARLRLAVHGALGAADEAKARTAHLREAFFATPKADPALLAELQDIEERLNDLLVKLRGNLSAGRRELPSPMSVRSRLERVVGNQWHVTSPPTQTQRDAYRYAGEEFAGLLAELREIVERDLVRVENVLEEAGAPWTPGRIPEWSME